MTARISDAMVRDLAVTEGVCIRPLMRELHDRVTGQTMIVPIPCGATTASKCPPCADKARRLRMQQCREGWHLTDELSEPVTETDDEPAGTEQGDEASEDRSGGDRRVRSTRRRSDAPDLPRMPMSDTTVGKAFGDKGFRPSMFITLTLGSYGPVVPGRGVPVDPERYDYRRAALDALHFPKLVDRWVQNLRRCAGYNVQYFAALEPQKRLTPHLHAAIRGAIPRQVIRQVTKATYLNLWWPQCAQPVYVHRIPVWDGENYLDADTGEILPTWTEALDQAEQDNTPAHVMRFGSQLDLQGIIAPSPDADRAVRYLTKYLTKSVTDTYDDAEEVDPARGAHIDRLHHEVLYLPCSPGCSNWLRYGVQPDQAGPGMVPGGCPSKAHDREHLGLGGRRVLVSRKWSGKTLTEHRADRAAVVRQTLEAAGIEATEADRCAADQILEDGSPRWVWTDTEVTPAQYIQAITHGITERRRWRAQYEHAKTLATGPPGHVDNRSATESAAPAA
jgi:hypothetical protein